MTISKQNQHCLDEFNHQPLTVNRVKQCLRIWESSHSIFTTLRNPSRLAHKKNFPHTLNRLYKVIENIPSSDREISNAVAQKIHNTILYRDSSHSSSAASLMSSANGVIKAIISTSTMRAICLNPMSHQQLSVKELNFLGSLSKKHITYAEIQQCANLYKPQGTFKNPVFKSLNFSKMGRGFRAIVEGREQHQKINHTDRGRLLEILTQDHRGGVIQTVLLSCRFFQSCITINNDATKEQLLAVLKEIAEWMGQHLPNRQSAQANIATLRFILEFPDVLDKYFGSVLGDYFNGHYHLIHLEVYQTRAEMHSTLRKLVIAIIQGYQKAKETDACYRFAYYLDRSGLCIEGNTMPLLEWCSKISDNKLIATEELSDINQLMGEATVTRPLAVGDNFAEVFKYYVSTLENQDCRYHEKYAPDCVVTRQSIVDYMVDCLGFDAPEPGVLNRLINPPKFASFLW